MMNIYRRLALSAFLLAVLPLTIALDSTHNQPEADLEPQNISGAYQDFLILKILKRYIRHEKETNVIVLEMTDYARSLPIKPYGDGWIIPNEMVFGSSMNRGMHAGTLIPFQGNWVVYWVVNGKITKDCELVLYFSEFDIPGMEIGFLPALGIYETYKTEAGKSMEWAMSFANGQNDQLVSLSEGGIWSENSYLYVRVEWNRVPPASMAGSPAAWEPPCKYTKSVLPSESEKRREELKPFISR